jgi:hypothetical protein
MAKRRNPGPFLDSFFISDQEIADIAKTRLQSLGLMPSSPEAVPIERYCDKRWSFPEDYADLPPGILGRAAFSETGLSCIEISRELSEDESRVGIVRTRSTLAHEIGHGELHAEAFAKKLRHDRLQGNLFADAADCSPKDEFLCRDQQIRSPRSEEWWEIQANRYMVALLLPKHLLREAVENWMPHKKNGRFHPITRMLDDEIAGIFNVGKEMARIAGEAMQAEIMRERQQLRAV